MVWNILIMHLCKFFIETESLTTSLLPVGLFGTFCKHSWPPVSLTWAFYPQLISPNHGKNILWTCVTPYSLPSSESWFQGSTGSFPVCQDDLMGHHSSWHLRLADCHSYAMAKYRDSWYPYLVFCFQVIQSSLWFHQRQIDSVLDISETNACNNEIYE